MAVRCKAISRALSTLNCLAALLRYLSVDTGGACMSPAAY